MAAGEKQPSRIDQLAKRMWRYASNEPLVLMRNLGYGGAAACLLILVGLVKVGAKDLPLQVTVVSSSIGLPLWLVLGVTYESYIFLGKQSYSHLRTPFATNFFFGVALIAGLALFVATGGVIYHLMPNAAWAFGVTSLACLGLVRVFYALLSRWWFSADGPGSREPEDDV